MAESKKSAIAIRLIPQGLINLYPALKEDTNKNIIITLSAIALFIIFAVYFLFRIIFTLYS